MFFKPKPNLPDNEKARIEFHLEQMAASIGRDRLRLPVLSLKSLSGLFDSSLAPDDIVGFVGEHLKHDVSGLECSMEQQELEKSGSGG